MPIESLSSLIERPLERQPESTAPSGNAGEAASLDPPDGRVSATSDLRPRTTLSPSTCSRIEGTFLSLDPRTPDPATPTTLLQQQQQQQQHCRRAQRHRSYSTETNRGHDDYAISDHDLWETYLPAYEMAFVDGGASGAMCSCVGRARAPRVGLRVPAACPRGKRDTPPTGRPAGGRTKEEIYVSHRAAGRCETKLPV